MNKSVQRGSFIDLDSSNQTVRAKGNQFLDHEILSLDNDANGAKANEDKLILKSPTNVNPQVKLDIMVQGSIDTNQKHKGNTQEFYPSKDERGNADKDDPEAIVTKKGRKPANDDLD